MQKTVNFPALAKAEAKSWAGVLQREGQERARTDPTTGELLLSATALSDFSGVPARTLRSWGLPSVVGPGRQSWHRWAVAFHEIQDKAFKRRGLQYTPDPLSPETLRRAAIADGASDHDADRAFMLASHSLRLLDAA